MIYKGSREMTARYYGSKVVTAVYKGAKLVWEAVSCCFSSGFWQKNLPWSNKEGWRN